MNTTACKINENILFSQWPDGLIAIDSNGKIITISKQASQILGWTQQDCEARLAHDILCLSNRNLAHDIAHCPLNLSNTPKGTFQSTTWLHKSGNYISIDFRLLDIQLCGCAYLISFIDNSERLHNQAEMEKFTEYVDKSPSFLAEFDSNGQLLFCNTAASTLLDQYDFNDLGQPNILPQNIELLCQKVLRTQESLIIESRVADTFFNWHFQLLRSGDESSVMGYAFDITQQKKAQQQIEEQKKQSRKEFFAKMVHELRTPLNAIVGFSDLLIMRLSSKLTETELSRLKSIKTAGLQLNDLVTDTLDFSKIESGKMTLDISEFSLTEVCDDIHEQMQTLANQKDLAYQFKSFSENLICSDKTKVRQIITNLVSNAIKYTMEGKVNLFLNETFDDELRDCFQIIVLDTGMGIPEDKISKLFTSYEQVENEKTRDIQGTGLGLALVNDLIKLLGGKINVTSEEGVGSSFDVLLPYTNPNN